MRGKIGKVASKVWVEINPVHPVNRDQNKYSDKLSDPDRGKAGRVMQAILQMKKIEIAELKKA